MKNKNNQKLNISAVDGGIAYFSFICLYVLITFLGQTILSVIFAERNTAYIAISSTFSALSFLIVTVGILIKSKSVNLGAVGIKKFNPLWLCFSLLLSVGMFFGLGFINTAFVNLLEVFGVKIEQLDWAIDSVGVLVIFAFVVGVLPAVLEEIFFRGLMINALGKVKWIYAFIIVSLCFSLYHGSVQQFIYQLVYGFALCLLYKASKSVIPCVISHFINNFAVLLLEFLKVEINLFNPFIIVGGLMILGVFFYFTIKKISANEKQNGVQTEKGDVNKFLFPYGLFGGIICLVMLISALFVGA